ncbi:unnamed protein product [Phaedon cochleariae]|uniref:Uncharacterized protein n=1 Tax=Phaedon cochleariae TaxID=80249 RepID=A0A9P0DB99_PHACE|nr:unnamed protein product [Phaedon cochleariae]
MLNSKESQDSHISAPCGVVFPPNKPMEPRKKFSTVPVVYDSLFFLDFNERGNCILGSSEVAGTFWEGTLLHFQDDKHMEDFDYNGHYIYSTASDGKFLTTNTIALAEDTGHINILSLDEDRKIRTTNYLRLGEHIPKIETWKDSNRILACAGRSVSIWEADCVERKPVEKFDNIHLEPVICVDTLKNNKNMFISGGVDRMACIWDLRNSVPCTVLYNNEFSSLMSISWNQYDDNYIIVGTLAGDVYLLDKREPKSFISVLHCFDRKVNRIGFNDAKEFAVCGDSPEVLIVNCKSSYLETIYRNGKHPGHVKDLKWHKGTLYTCGFGKCVVKHVRQK